MDEEAMERIQRKFNETKKKRKNASKNSPYNYGTPTPPRLIKKRTVYGKLLKHEILEDI